MIYASSDKAYGELGLKKYKETDKLNGIYPYDVSKATSDLICQSYSYTYGLSVGILRCGNLYGPGDFNLKRIVPETIINTLRNKKLKIRSNGKLLRDYLYVGDAAHAYYLVMMKLLKEKKNKIKIYNVSSNFNASVLNLVKKIQYKINKKFNYSITNISNKEIKKQKMNFSKISKDLNWYPKTNLETGLDKTISWYKKNLPLFK
jgi:CDP-glucose 4,6-dehydratase